MLRATARFSPSGPAGPPFPFWPDGHLPRIGGVCLAERGKALGPLCEGAPAAAGGGENFAAIRNILGYGKVLSLRPCGATSLAEGGKKVVGKNFLNYTTPPCIL